MRAAMKTDIPRIKSRIARVDWAVKSDFRARAQKAMRETRMFLVELTPKASGKMASGWRMRVIGGSKKGRVPVAGWIWNHYAEKGRWRYGSRDFKARFTNLETGRINTRSRKVKVDGRTVLRVLEFGSAPHVIRAAHATKTGKPGFLKFRAWETGSSRAGSKIGGEWVFVRKVEHPGTRPHAMIRLARILLKTKIHRVLRETARVPQKVMRGEIRG